MAWKPKPGETWNGLPDAQGFSFNTIPGCSTPNPVIPNDCSYPRPEYWNVLDNLVEQANVQNIAVLMAGLIDPVDLGKDRTYPNLANARDFARYLAARLAGNHVLYSPSFDDRTDSKTQDLSTTVQSVISSVGTDLKTAAPRHLVTVHLAGAFPCTAYQAFQGSSWMTFYMFHSGHAFSQNGVATDICPGWLNTETRQQAAIRRAREMPLTFSGYTSPTKPNLNGEGPYDAFPNATEPDTRYRVRQAGHASSLSNAQGFTYGATNMGLWDNASTYFGLPSSFDMQQLILRFKNRAGLPARHSWILNQPAAPNHEKRMDLASNTSNLVLAYLPKEATQIVINTSSLPGLVCGSTTWTIKWFNPTESAADTQILTCTQGTNQITVKEPTLCPDPTINPDCDWVLELQRTGAGLASSALSPSVEGLEVWAEFSQADGTSAIYASPTNSAQGDASSILLSPPGKAFQQSPRVARHGDGYFVAWHGDGLDGSLYSVFAQRIDRNGRLLSEPFQVNTYTQHDQRDPAVASAPSGEAVVVWSSYGQDGDLGGIFGQRFDRFGKPVGGEFAVNTAKEGHQAAPQVAFDSMGNFIVAWTTEAGETFPSGISFQRFDRNGKPLGDEFFLSSPGDTFVHLVDLAVSAQGDFSVRWAAQDLQNRSRGQFLQRFDAMGRATGPQNLVDGAD